jgi:UV DNA damage repair endonuclease
MPKIGFACKIVDAYGTTVPDLNTKSTTITWLDRQPRTTALARLWDLVRHNVVALNQQLKYVALRPEHLRMFRITSDILPAYTHDNYWEFYQDPDMTRWLERELIKTGDYARQHNIRLSFHPGQFCVLASENPQVVERSIEEFEYHCDVIRYLGYGREFQDFKCNVHIGGKLGPAGIKAAVRRLSTVARNVLTIENAEFTWGLQHSLELVDTCALVLDIHHHWIMTGEYIEPDDPRIAQVIASWRGVRPVIHYSLSREDVLVDHCVDTQPELAGLKASGFTSTKLRAHSEMMWNRASNRWAKRHNAWADIMIEAKQKNLAVDSFLLIQ